MVLLRHHEARITTGYEPRAGVVWRLLSFSRCFGLRRRAGRHAGCERASVQDGDRVSWRFAELGGFGEDECVFVLCGIGLSEGCYC